ncbi:MAG: glycosyltransferase family 39 protein, partial [FCB group bacterium]|nr:glycosyltransferase family 39 protein [FCB group bacterium]
MASKNKQGNSVSKSAPARSSFWRREPGLLLIPLLFALLWGAFAGLDTFSPFEQRVVGVDPVGYYVWFRSPVFDADLQFENEYRALMPGKIHGDTLVDPNGPRTATGHLQNAFSLGPALLWSPFLFVAHAVAWAGGWTADGYGQPYHSAVFFANAFYGLLGTLLVYAALRCWFAAGVATLSAVAVWAASPLLYYTFGQEAMSHTVSYCCVALFLFAWVRLREREGYMPWILIGAALGLATLARWQNVTFALVPTVDLLARDWKRDFPRLVACGAATV